MPSMVNTNKLGKGNRRLKRMEWTDKDVEKSNEMVDKIDKTLKRREQLRRLEEYVSGRPKTVNPRTLVPSCSVIYDLEPLSLSFDFVVSSEIFKSFSLRSLSSCDLVSLADMLILCIILKAC
ncbi:hypothetical protein Tco_1514580 [Tanacetum coccineum]